MLQYLSNYSCIVFAWPVAPSNTLVLLSELELTVTGYYYLYSYEISISGCSTGKIVLSNSNFSSLWYGVNMILGPSCKDLLFVCENTTFYNVTVGLTVTDLSPQYSHENTLAVTLHNLSYYGEIATIYVIVTIIATVTSRDQLEQLRPSTVYFRSLVLSHLKVVPILVFFL